MQKIKSDIWFVVAIFFVIIIFADLVLILFSDGNLVSLPTHAALPYGFDTNKSEDFWAQRGQWGDMLSGHFAAMAFILLFYTAMLQRKELKEMREEAIQQTMEFKTQTTYMKYDRLFNQLRQYIDGVYIGDRRNGNGVYGVYGASLDIRISGYSALSEILDKSKRPEYSLVNFAHIKLLIFAYTSIIKILQKESSGVKDDLERELAIIISLDNIELLWKLYICSQLMNLGPEKISIRLEYIESQNKKMFANTTLKAWSFEVEQLINRSNTSDVYRSLTIKS